MTSLNRMRKVVRDPSPRPLPKAEPPPKKPAPLKLSARVAAAGAAGLTAIVAVIIGITSIRQSTAAESRKVENGIRAYSVPSAEGSSVAGGVTPATRPAAQDLSGAIQAKSESANVIHVKGYYKKDGTYVHGYTRRR